MKADTIVVGVDGSENARDALDTATGLLQPGGSLHLVTAFHMPSTSETGLVLSKLPKEFRDTYDPLAMTRSYLEIAESSAKAAGVNVTAHFVEDHPAAAILEVAESVDADLIVVGSRGLGRGTRFLRGSVSARIANHAKTSFLVVHDDH